MNDESDTIEIPKRVQSHWVSIVGVGLTLIYLVGGAVHFYLETSKSGVPPLNELGDFLAGFFGPLAFAWLVLGYFQQRKELSLNSDALYLQYRELSNSVRQQKKLVQATEAARADENKRMRAAYRPIFSIQYRGQLGSTERHFVYNFLLTNIGAPIYEIQFDLSRSLFNENSGLVNTYTSTWETNGTRELRLSLNSPQDAVVGLEYKDQAGYIGQVVFDVKSQNYDSPGSISEMSERRATAPET